MATDRTRRLSVALIGTRGVPARYGGFETAVEEVGRRLVDMGHQVTVFCRGRHDRSTYLGMRLITVPALRNKFAETLSHTALSVLHPVALKADACIVFNAANAPLVPMLRLANVPTAVHVDGLEWKRSKWNGFGRRYYKLCERLAVRLADDLIADAVGIQEYYAQEYGAATRLISYGAPIIQEPSLDRLAEMGLKPGGYHLVVARLEPENHVREIVRAFRTSESNLPLVVVGENRYGASYVEEIRRVAAQDPRVKLAGAIWDQALLDALYAGCRAYVHGHSVGGTNPSLLRAAGAAAPVLAYDVGFNREVLGEWGRYWVSESDLAHQFLDSERCPDAADVRGLRIQEGVAARYDWDIVARQYEEMLLDLAGASAEGVRRRRRRETRRPSVPSERTSDLDGR